MAVGLTIASQSLDITGAWEHNMSLTRLIGTAQSRGSNRLIPNNAGRTAYAILRDEVIVDLELEIYGVKNSAGAAHANEFDGLTANMAYLYDFVLDGMASGAAATRAATLELPNSRTFTADVQILNWRVVRQDVLVAYVSYDLRIPGGIWTDTTP